MREEGWDLELDGDRASVEKMNVLRRMVVITAEQWGCSVPLSCALKNGSDVIFYVTCVFSHLKLIIKFLKKSLSFTVWTRMPQTVLKQETCTASCSNAGAPASLQPWPLLAHCPRDAGISGCCSQCPGQSLSSPYHAPSWAPHLGKDTCRWNPPNPTEDPAPPSSPAWVTCHMLSVAGLSLAGLQSQAAGLPQEQHHGLHPRQGQDGEGAQDVQIPRQHESCRLCPCPGTSPTLSESVPLPRISGSSFHLATHCSQVNVPEAQL